MDTKVADDRFYQVLDGLLEGGKLYEVLKRLKVRPMEWHRALQEDVKLAEGYEAAKVVMSDLMASEMVRIADDDGIEIGRATNMLKARMWLASKWNVKGYGDRMDVNVTKVVDIGVALRDARERVKGIDVVEVEAKRVLIDEMKGESE